MSAPLPFLLATDECWQRCPNIVEVSSAAWDRDLTGIGSTPWQGDLGSTGVRVPTAPTTSPNNRYLIRLCGVEIPVGFSILIRGLRQFASLRHTETINGLPLIIERPIVTPLWRFLDGNISWHLRIQKQQFAPLQFDSVQAPGTDPSQRNLDSALLYVPPLVPYVAPGNGLPPGEAVGQLGTFRDIRFPWDDVNWTMSALVPGPGSVVFYASVFQPSFVDRPLYPSVAGVVPEDQFLSNFRDARYGRVAGAMIFEMLAPKMKPSQRASRVPTPGRAR